ncbi:hypothetical protein TSOC_011332 [Tetrabaena socialis]|uniref:RING-type domain-containing protein n=1 Tax=Tetrabaena socialis TaxID=47790 RepID=A0A2J7ZQX7_9CHLO|nr:hypothetical protein TSOC_011332 [Tetrabaena socialis]|eukprot:PNH02667.1 hypothetical protein TSOC_011332 [Tetrabaena socialis]
MSQQARGLAAAALALKPQREQQQQQRQREQQQRQRVQRAQQRVDARSRSSSAAITAPPAYFAGGTDGLEADWASLDCMSYLFAPDRPEEAAATQQLTGPRSQGPSGGEAAERKAADAGPVLGSSAASSGAMEGLEAGAVVPEVSAAVVVASGGVQAAAGGPMQRGSGSDSGPGGGGEEGSCCLVCLDAPREHGFLHGGSMHFGVCGGCAARLAAEKRRRGSRLLCPVCREPVERMVALFATGSYSAAAGSTRGRPSAAAAAAAAAAAWAAVGLSRGRPAASSAGGGAAAGCNRTWPPGPTTN